MAASAAALPPRALLGAPVWAPAPAGPGLGGPWVRAVVRAVEGERVELELEDGRAAACIAADCHALNAELVEVGIGCA